MRSTSAPTISAPVMMTKVSWNMAYTDSGTFGATWLTGHQAGFLHVVKPAEPHAVRAAQPRRAGREGQRITHCKPQQAEQAGNGHARWPWC